MGRILELDGLRGIAIALVLLFHIALYVPPLGPVTYNFMISGWSGVDLFFVLSGFLIGGILIDQRDAQSYFGPFYARRFFRIVPVYLAVVGIYFSMYLAGGIVRHALVSTVQPPMPWYTYLTFTNNFFLARHDMGYFLPVSWSLAVEEQFYLTLPVLVRFTPRRALPYLVAAITVTVLVFRAWACYTGAATQDQAYVLTFFRADALMIGVGCALLVRSERLRSFVMRHPFCLYCALALLGGVILRLGTRLPDSNADPRSALMMFGLTVIALFYACLLLLAVVVKPRLLSRALTWKPLRALGDVSYFVYLSHQALLIATVTSLPHPKGFWRVPLPWITAIFTMVATFFIARISWRVLEGRMIRYGHRFRYEERPATVGSEVQEVA